MERRINIGVKGAPLGPACPLSWALLGYLLLDLEAPPGSGVGAAGPAPPGTGRALSLNPCSVSVQSPVFVFIVTNISLFFFTPNVPKICLFDRLLSRASSLPGGWAPLHPCGARVSARLSAAHLVCHCSEPCALARWLPVTGTFVSSDVPLPQERTVSPVWNLAGSLSRGGQGFGSPSLLPSCVWRPTFSSHSGTLLSTLPPGTLSPRASTSDPFTAVLPFFK